MVNSFFSAFIGQVFLCFSLDTMRTENLPERIKTNLNTGSDQTVWVMHGSNNWFSYLYTERIKNRRVNSFDDFH